MAKQELTEEQRAKFSKIGKSNVATSKAHERRVKKLLTDWSGRQFRRRRIEGRGDDVAVVEGVADIIPIDGQVIVAIEAKKEEGFSFDSLLANPATNGKFTKWWHQVCYDAQILTEKVGEKRWPMLFFKPHPNWDWVAVAQEPFEKNIIKRKKESESPSNYLMYSDIWLPHLAFDAYAYCGEVERDVSRTKNKKNKQMVSLQLETCYFFRWRDFADHVDPESIFVQT
jgi:hypothetical protein